MKGAFSRWVKFTPGTYRFSGQLRPRCRRPCPRSAPGLGRLDPPPLPRAGPTGPFKWCRAAPCRPKLACSHAPSLAVSRPFHWSCGCRTARVTSHQITMSYDDVHWHRLMLQDEVRTGAFRRAIQSVVEPRHRVLDFGCGTGVLAFFAARAGASTVYASEATHTFSLLSTPSVVRTPVTKRPRQYICRTLCASSLLRFHAILALSYRSVSKQVAILVHGTD